MNIFAILKTKLNWISLYQVSFKYSNMLYTCTVYTLTYIFFFFKVLDNYLIFIYLHFDKLLLSYRECNHEYSLHFQYKYHNIYDLKIFISKKFNYTHLYWNKNMNV